MNADIDNGRINLPPIIHGHSRCKQAEVLSAFHQRTLELIPTDISPSYSGRWCTTSLASSSLPIYACSRFNPCSHIRRRSIYLQLTPAVNAPRVKVPTTLLMSLCPLYPQSSESPPPCTSAQRCAGTVRGQNPWTITSAACAKVVVHIKRESDLILCVSGRLKLFVVSSESPVRKEG